MTKKPRDMYPFHDGSPTARALALQQYGPPHQSTVRTIGWWVLAPVLGGVAGWVGFVCWTIGSKP